MRIYTDGSCLLNDSSVGGPSGLGYVILHSGSEVKKSIGYYRSTNNRMELLAIILPLEELQFPTSVEIITDSQYSIDGATLWIYSWLKRKWKTKDGKPVANSDLFKRLHELLKFHDVKFTKVKGHSNDYYNEMCDQLAKAGAHRPTEVDFGFIAKTKK